MLYIFTTTRGMSNRSHLHRALINCGLSADNIVPIFILQTSYMSERTLFWEITNELESMNEDKDYYYFTLSALEFDIIRMLVKRGSVFGGVKVVVFDKRCDIIAQYDVDKDGNCDIYGDYDIFDTHHDVLSELL